MQSLNRALRYAYMQPGLSEVFNFLMNLGRLLDYKHIYASEKNYNRKKYNRIYKEVLRNLRKLGINTNANNVQVIILYVKRTNTYHIYIDDQDKTLHFVIKREKNRNKVFTMLKHCMIDRILLPRLNNNEIFVFKITLVPKMKQFYEDLGMINTFYDVSDNEFFITVTEFYNIEIKGFGSVGLFVFK